jgi:hypothetical protein
LTVSLHFWLSNWSKDSLRYLRLNPFNQSGQFCLLPDCKFFAREFIFLFRAGQSYLLMLDSVRSFSEVHAGIYRLDSGSQKKIANGFWLNWWALCFLFPFPKGSLKVPKFLVCIHWAFYHFIWSWIVVLRWGSSFVRFKYWCFFWVNKLNQAWTSKFFGRFSIFRFTVTKLGCRIWVC